MTLAGVPPPSDETPGPAAAAARDAEWLDVLLAAISIPETSAGRGDRGSLILRPQLSEIVCLVEQQQPAPPPAAALLDPAAMAVATTSAAKNERRRSSSRRRVSANALAAGSEASGGSGGSRSRSASPTSPTMVRSRSRSPSPIALAMKAVTPSSSEASRPNTANGFRGDAPTGGGGATPPRMCSRPGSSGVGLGGGLDEATVLSRQILRRLYLTGHAAGAAQSACEAQHWRISRCLARRQLTRRFARGVAQAT